MKKCFPFLTACGGQLEVVDMRHCSLLSVPDEVLRNTRSIEECYLDANQIKDLPKNFFKLSRVKIITISDNELTYIPENIGNFLHLIELDLSRNRIGSLHHNIRFCNELRNLDLSNNPINRLPEGFSSLRNLTNLNLIDISLTELPTDFGNLVALQKLELRDNCLRDLPSSFAKLQHLELLDIGGNEFQVFPKPLGKLIQLKVLCIENNEIQVIPKEIGTLKNLQELDMSENFIAEIADEIGNLGAMTDLVLSQNSLDVLPNTLGNLKNLSVLKVEQNKLMSVTSQIGECSKLQELYLTENFIQRLPGTMGKLSQLVHLKVDQNHLTAIPSELIKCDQITIMSFRGNRIRKLPADIGFMSNLHVLDVSNNLLERLPISIAECPLKALWLSENQSQSLVKLQIDVDADTKEKFLTCYLLPQSGTEDLEQVQNADAVEAAKSLPYDFRMNPNSSDHTNNTSGNPIGGSQHSNTGSAVVSPPLYSNEGFYPNATEVDKQHDVSQTSYDQVKVRFNDESHSLSNRLSKENLPKTRHPKLDKKAIDGHIIPKETHANKDLKFAPNRHSSHEYKAAQYRTKKTSAPPDMAPNPNSFRLTTENGTAGNLQSVTENDMLVKRSHSDAGLQQSEMELGQPQDCENGGGSSSDGSMRVKPDHAEDDDDIQVKTRKHRHGVKMDDNVHDISRDSRDLATPDNRSSNRLHNRELTTYSSGGEEIDGFNRRVEFSNETEDNEETGLRLIRRDTPHYTKKARIHDVSADGTKNEDVVKQIMEKYKQSPSPLPGQGTSSASHSRSNSATDSHQPIVQMRAANQVYASPTQQSAPTYDQVIAASALARGSNVPPGLQSATRSTEEMQIRVVREYGEQLGMSIAGGIGSSPHQPVFVSRLTDTGAAHKAGLMVNDRILEVNGETFIDIEHGAAVSVLKNAGMSFNMVIQRDYVVAPPPLTTAGSLSHTNQAYSSSAGFSKTVTSTGFTSPSNVTGTVDSGTFMASPGLDPINSTYSSGDHNHEDVDVTFQTIIADVVRDENGLGFSIAGGKGCMDRELSDKRWAFLESIYICKISPNGAADKCKMLQVGDKIVKINGIDVSDARHDQAVVLLSGSESNIRLEVQRQVIVQRSASTAAASDVPDLSESSSTPAVPGVNYSKYGVGVTSFDEYDEANKEVVKIVKTSGQLGLSICGGIDHCAHPFGVERPGIFINKITATGAANACGKLQIGDRILSVNGHDIRQATHDQVIDHFMQSSSSEIVLEVVHEPQPPGFEKLTITKELKEKLGINIQGGNDGFSMNPDDPKDKGVFVTKILPDGAVYRDGRLKVGHRLIEVNSRSFMGIPLNRATKVLVEVTTQMDVIVCDGVSPEKIELALSHCNNAAVSNIASNGPAISPGSVSPLSWKNQPESPNHPVNAQLITTMPTSVPCSSHSPSSSLHPNHNSSAHITSSGMTSRHSKPTSSTDLLRDS